MSSQLPIECLNNIFEYLEDDKTTLYSCLLVNRLYCKVAVEILWKDVWNFQNDNYEPKSYVLLSIFNTLITFLTKESKDRLCNSGINFINFTEKHALFNYPSFCKTISFIRIKKMINCTLENQQIIILGVFNHSKYLLTQEILKMFMNKISSLKSLDYSSCTDNNFEFIYSPGTKICLKDLVELRCDTNVSPEFFSQLSQICHHIQSLIIFLNNYSNKDHKIVIPDGLTDLISSQNNLKSLRLKGYYCDENTIRILTPSLVKSSFTMTKIELYAYNASLSFISMFENLQEINLWFSYGNSFDGFENLQFVNFPQLKVLKFKYKLPKIEFLTNFLEINGKNLTEFYIYGGNKSINLVISKFCPNIKNLYLNFTEDNEDELITLKMVLNNCQFLESILVQIHQITCRKLFGILGEYSSKNFHELKIKLGLKSTYNVLIIGLEEYFINWIKYNNPQNLLSLNIIGYYTEISNPKVTMTIEKYMKMGLIKEYNFQWD